MAAFRLVLIVLLLAAFLVAGLPLQWAILRIAPGASRFLPVAFCRSLLFLMRVDVDVRGSSSSDRPLLLAANHVSWIDIAVLGAISPFCFLAKSDVASWPILSAFVVIQGTVFVDRMRKRSIPSANRELATRMSEGRPVLLFPEGTTSDTPAPNRFRSSHFATAQELLRKEAALSSVAVQPVAIAYSSKAAAWVGDDDLLAHLWRTLKNPRLRCLVAFGDPLSYMRDSDRKQIARAVERTVTSLLQSQSVPLFGEVDLTHDDIRIPAAETY